MKRAIAILWTLVKMTSCVVTIVYVLVFLYWFFTRFYKVGVIWHWMWN